MRIVVSSSAIWPMTRSALHLGEGTGAQAYGRCTFVSWPCIATSATLRGVGSGVPVQSVNVLTSTPLTLQQHGLAPNMYGRSCFFAHQRPAEVLDCGNRRQLSSWAVLGLDPREADAGAVKKAYFEAAKSCHPDLHGTTAANVQRFRELSLAVDDILRELRDGGGWISCAEDGVGATKEGASSSTEVSRDDPEFASSYFEFINREMSDTTRAEIKAAVEMGGGGLDRGGWWAAAQQMAHDVDTAGDTAVEQRRLANPSGGAGSRHATRESAATSWKRSRRRRRR